MNERLAGVLSRADEVMRMNAEIQRDYREAQIAKRRAATAAGVAAWKAREPGAFAAYRRRNSATRRADRVAARQGIDPALVTEADRLADEWMGAEVFVCGYCGKPVEQGERTVDHRQAVSRGGKHEPTNLVRACRRCNSRKNTRSSFYA